MVNNKSNTRKKASVLDNDALLLVTPINKTHASAITTLKKAMALSERTEKALETAQGRAAVAKEKLTKARANAKEKKSDAAKTSAIRAGEAMSKVNETLAEKKQATKDVAIVLKQAANEVKAGIEKEEARQKAVMLFSNKWEKEYDRKMAAKAKPKTKTKAKKPSMKKAASESA